LELKLTPQEIKERQELRGSTEYRDPAQSVEQPGALPFPSPEVAREGVDRIAIQLPGLQNSAEVKKILGKTATLDFRMVDENNNPWRLPRPGMCRWVRS